MKKHIIYFIAIVAVGVLAWYRTLDFWFFRAYEAIWLKGIAPYNIVNLIRAHAFLYYLDWKIFGWHPWGWYLTSIIFHVIATLILFQFLFILTKRRLLSFITGLFFVASTSYNDVLTWGSFNSYYPLLLIWMLATLILFQKYRETKKIPFLILSIVFSFLAFFTRETGILVVVLLTVFDFIFTKNYNRKVFIDILKRQIPFYIALIIFFIIRSFYGGTGGDFADSNVKLQVKLIHDGLYVEYARTVLLTFGKLIPPQIIPYPLLNQARESLYKSINIELVNVYFFPLIGLAFYFILGLIIFFFRNDKKYLRLLTFFWLWIGAFSLFVALAIPSIHEVLIKEYIYNEMRYRYFAYVGTSAFIGTILIFLYDKIRKDVNIKIAQVFLFLMLSSFVLLNLVFIWRIEQEVYTSTYKPAKDFYKQFNSYFPSLPKKVAFYIYPYAPGLGDYLLEWFFIKENSYPNLTGEPFRVESQVAAVLNKIKTGEINLADTIFLDYDNKKGLLNKTKETKAAILNQKDYMLRFKKDKVSHFDAKIVDGPTVEIPYNVEVTMSSSLGNEDITQFKSPNSEVFRALVDYSIDRKRYLDNVKIKTSPTMSQRPGEPFLHIVADNLIDGNAGPRSSWIADAIPAWIEADLGEEKDIYAVVWGAIYPTRTPATYTFFSSTDGATWNKEKTVKNNSKSSDIDKFEKPIKARYIKIVVNTTSSGDFASIDEFEVVTAQGKQVLQLYTDRDTLLNDSRNMFKFLPSQQDISDTKQRGLDVYWGKLSWETDISSDGATQYVYFPYQLNNFVQKIIIKLPEAEIFAGSGQFFNKHISSVSLDFSDTPFIINVTEFKLLPRLKI